ncbi:MAG: hypothetical protein H7315_07915 [Herminiimonas sp.]|nr:hypothetical protein [Herminiimonas sp.]
MVTHAMQRPGQHKTVASLRIDGAQRSALRAVLECSGASKERDTIAPPQSLVKRLQSIDNPIAVTTAGR